MIYSQKLLKNIIGAGDAKVLAGEIKDSVDKSWEEIHQHYKNPHRRPEDAPELAPLQADIKELLRRVEKHYAVIPATRAVLDILQNFPQQTPPPAQEAPSGEDLEETIRKEIALALR